MASLTDTDVTWLGMELSVDWVETLNQDIGSFKCMNKVLVKTHLTLNACWSSHRNTNSSLGSSAVGVTLSS